eukprot:COSAG01_NODE_11474_length_1927_cov_1.038293_2_plen_111_part_00
MRRGGVAEARLRHHTACLLGPAAGDDGVEGVGEDALFLEILAGLKDFDSPTIFNAVEKVTGDVTPSRRYTDQSCLNLLPELGSFIGTAVTVSTAHHHHHHHYQRRQQQYT